MVTIVTYKWNVNDDISTLLRLPINLIVYTRKNFAREIVEFRTKFIITDNLRIECLSDNFFETFELGWFTGKSRNPYKLLDTTNTISWTKYCFITRSISHDPFKSNFWIWIDPEFANLPKAHFLCEDQVFTRPNEGLRLLVDCNNVMNLGFITGEQKNWIKFLHTYYERLKCGLNSGLLPDAENILQCVIREKNYLFEYYWGERDDIIINYRKPREVMGIYNLLKLFKEKNMLFQLSYIIKYVIGFCNERLWDYETTVMVQHWKDLIKILD